MEDQSFGALASANKNNWDMHVLESPAIQLYLEIDGPHFYMTIGIPSIKTIENLISFLLGSIQNEFDIVQHDEVTVIEFLRCNEYNNQYYIYTQPTDDINVVFRHTLSSEDVNDWVDMLTEIHKKIK